RWSSSSASSAHAGESSPSNSTANRRRCSFHGDAKPSPEELLKSHLKRCSWVSTDVYELPYFLDSSFITGCQCPPLFAAERCQNSEGVVDEKREEGYAQRRTRTRCGASDLANHPLIRFRRSCGPPSGRRATPKTRWRAGGRNTNASIFVASPPSRRRESRWK